MLRHLILTASLLATIQAARAGAIDQLHQFLADTRSGKADFAQRVVTHSGKIGQTASGTMSFLRPGKFRWEYSRPYSQLIVGDGAKLWSYDKELNQVVVKTQGRALGASPAALLAGDNTLGKNFTLSEAGLAGGLEWLEAIPKNNESGFELVKIGFKSGLPMAMEVRDNFGQTTLLEFSDFQRNTHLSADSFRFVAPKGADVVGDDKGL